MKFLTKCLALLLISFLVVGCTGGKVEGEDVILKVAKSSDVISLDTHVATDGVSFEVIKAFTEGLVEYDADGNIIAGVAKAWDVSADGKVYTFTLREDAFWSNGTKVTAADFVYGFQRLADPAKTHQYSYLVESLKIVNGAAVIAGEKPVTDLGVKAEGDFKFVVTLDAAVPYFMQLMTFPSFHPVNEAFVTAAGDKYATTVEFLISNGPFVLTEWISGSLIKFAKNDKYWDKAAVKLDGLEFQIFKDYQSAALEYEAGTVDVTAITSNIVDRYKDDAGYTEVKLGYVWFLSPNQLDVTMQNKNLRLALAHAFDRAQIADNLLGDGSIVATTTIKKDRLDLMNTGKYQLGLTRWGPDFADPLTYLKDLFETGSPYNYPRFSNAEYDAIIASVSPGGDLAADLNVRWDTLKQAEALLLGEAGVIPAWQTGTAMLISTKVSGIEYHVVGMPCYKRATKVE